MTWFDDGGQSKLDAAQLQAEEDAFFAERLRLEEQEREEELRHRIELHEKHLLQMQILREDALLEMKKDLSDPHKLEAIAEWFEIVYPRWKQVVREQQKKAGLEQSGTTDDSTGTVEADLRRIANRVRTLDEIENPKPYKAGQAFEVRDTSRRRYG